jgi:ATP-dependent DNA ligase
MDDFANLKVPLATAPMEAKLVSELPDDGRWQFEPKWDGFRCLAYRDGDEVALMSKSGKPLGRYFPEMVEAALQTKAERWVADGEIVLPSDDGLAFDKLQQRLHPAASRIARLSRETPAELVLFDCLQLGDEVAITAPLSERRALLERFVKMGLPRSFRLSPKTEYLAVAEDWLERSGGALDGIIAKRLDQAYLSGERGMLKRKLLRTADCVVGGYRLDAKGKLGSLLLGLYGSDGKLYHVGFTSALDAGERAAALERLEPLKGTSAFDGSSPGGPSRWNNGKETEWTPTGAQEVVEVVYDQVTGRRFRHGTRFLRWRPDKAPRQCTMEQLRHELKPAELADLPLG